MHAGDWITLAVAVALLAGIVSVVVRARRKRRAAPPQQHGPVTGGQKNDEAAVMQIGTVAADAARSASG